jgi:Coenzyme PQQ synthesis protein D (PqqD)
VKEIRDVLLAEYEITQEECDRDLLVLLQDLAGRGLIEVKNEVTA